MVERQEAEIALEAEIEAAEINKFVLQGQQQQNRDNLARSVSDKPSNANGDNDGNTSKLEKSETTNNSAPIPAKDSSFSQRYLANFA